MAFMLNLRRQTNLNREATQRAYNKNIKPLVIKDAMLKSLGQIIVKTKLGRTITKEGYGMINALAKGKYVMQSGKLLEKGVPTTLTALDITNRNRNIKVYEKGIGRNERREKSYTHIGTFTKKPNKTWAYTVNGNNSTVPNTIPKNAIGQLKEYKTLKSKIMNNKNHTFVFTNMKNTINYNDNSESYKAEINKMKTYISNEAKKKTAEELKRRKAEEAEELQNSTTAFNKIVKSVFTNLLPSMTNSQRKFLNNIRTKFMKDGNQENAKSALRKLKGNLVKVPRTAVKQKKKPSPSPTKTLSFPANLPNGARFMNGNTLLNIRQHIITKKGNNATKYSNHVYGRNNNNETIGTINFNQHVFTYTSKSKNSNEPQKPVVAPKKNSKILKKIPSNVDYSVLKFGKSTKSPIIFSNTNVKNTKLITLLKGLNVKGYLLKNNQNWSYLTKKNYKIKQRARNKWQRAGKSVTQNIRLEKLVKNAEIKNKEAQKAQTILVKELSNVKEASKAMENGQVVSKETINNLRKEIKEAENAKSNLAQELKKAGETTKETNKLLEKVKHNLDLQMRMAVNHATFAEAYRRRLQNNISYLEIKELNGMTGKKLNNVITTNQLIALNKTVSNAMTQLLNKERREFNQAKENLKSASENNKSKFSKELNKEKRKFNEALTKQANEIRSKITELQTLGQKSNSKNNKISTLESKLNAITKEKANLTSQVLSLESVVTNNVIAKRELKATLNEQANELRSKINELKTLGQKSTSNTSKISGLESNLRAITAEKANLNAKVSSLESVVTQARQEYERKSGENRKQAKREFNTALKQQENALRSQINTLTKSTGTKSKLKNSKISGLESKLGLIIAEKAELNLQVSSNSSQLIALRNNVARLRLETQHALKGKYLSNENKKGLQQELRNTQLLQQKANVAKNSEISVLKSKVEQQTKNLKRIQSQVNLVQPQHLPPPCQTRNTNCIESAREDAYKLVRNLTNKDMPIKHSEAISAITRWRRNAGKSIPSTWIHITGNMRLTADERRTILTELAPVRPKPKSVLPKSALHNSAFTTTSLDDNRMKELLGKKITTLSLTELVKLISNLEKLPKSKLLSSNANKQKINTKIANVFARIQHIKSTTSMKTLSPQLGKKSTKPTARISGDNTVKQFTSTNPVSSKNRNRALKDIESQRIAYGKTVRTNITKRATIRGTVSEIIHRKGTNFKYIFTDNKKKLYKQMFSIT